MPLTKKFVDLVQNRAAGDPQFAAALARERCGTRERSPVIASILETAEGLHAAGAMDADTLRRLDKMCRGSLPLSENEHG